MISLVKKIIRPVYKKLQHIPLVQMIEEEFEIQAYSGVTSRNFEYAFGISELINLSHRKKVVNILDAGSCGSPFAPILASLGFSVKGVDLIPWELKFPRYTHVVGDLKNLSFENNVFDAVTVISTMEHCGLSRFSETHIKNGDICAMKELIRVLKPKGYFLLTVPYAANSYVYQNKHRIYNSVILKKLLGKLVIKKKQFFAPIVEPGVFQPCSKKEIEDFKSVNGSHGVICVLAQKS